MIVMSFRALAQLSLPGPGQTGLPPDAVMLLLFLAGVLGVTLLVLWQGRRRHAPARHKDHKNWILVDGSNVMHWQDNMPKLDPLIRVIVALRARGFDPGVVFDANAGWKLFGRYLGERELGHLLDLPQDQVLVVPKGSPADPWLLTTAREFGARIVTNDRYRDWTADHPELAQPGFLVRGGLTGQDVWLEGLERTPEQSAP